jgi:protein TonB
MPPLLICFVKSKTMDTNKILSARWLDILFDNRNKDYGAYELRNTYPQRIRKALVSTCIFAGIVLGSMALSGPGKKQGTSLKPVPGIELKVITESKPPQRPPEQRRATVPAAPRVQSAILTPPRIVTGEITRRMATQEELLHAMPGITANTGTPFTGIVAPASTGDSNGTGTSPVIDLPEEPIRNAQVPSRFLGDWIKFLRKNLNPDVPVDNEAPPGRYTILIEFVVDKEGNVSDIKPLTKAGYGMEEEAIRVLRKASRWEPALQNGIPVKAYHKQPITFEVLGEE